MKEKTIIFIKKIRSNWWVIGLVAIGILLQLLLIFQIFYPINRLLPFTKIDGISLGGWKKNDALNRVDHLYRQSSLSIYLGSSEKPYLTSELVDMGLVVGNKGRIGEYSYPWYLRVVPTSIFWGQHLFGNHVEPNYERDEKILAKYIDSNFDESGVIEAKNATLEHKDGKLIIIPGQSGGRFTIKSVKDILHRIKPVPGNNRVVIRSNEIKPGISDAAAEKFGEELIKKAGSGVNITVNQESIKVPVADILSWMDFGSDGGKMTYNLSSVRAADYMEKQIAPKVIVAAGQTFVTTYDFNEVSRVVGKSGQGLDVVETLNSIKMSIDSGSGSAKAMAIAISPTEVYERGYSPTDAGISALIKQYAEKNKGIKSVSFVDLSGAHRRAEYNSNETLISASTYKLFVAYSALARIEDKKWAWTDKILDDGRDLAACFDDMIVKSDNPCAETIAQKAGWGNVTKEAHLIGCTNTNMSNADGYARTSSADLALFLAQLQTGQILKEQASRDLLMNAMKRNIYRKGIPAGVDWPVADKVGFINGVLNDAAIVYAPSGAYILVIMTDGSNWATIADLANIIETLQAK